MRFRKRPVAVEAEQWFPGKRVEGVLLHGDSGFPLWFEDEHGHRYPSGPDVAFVGTLEGTMTVREGDWIVTGVKGEKYPCKPDIFAATYEPAE
jgi:hypothetical protein